MTLSSSRKFFFKDSAANDGALFDGTDIGLIFSGPSGGDDSNVVGNDFQFTTVGVLRVASAPTDPTPTSTITVPNGRDVEISGFGAQSVNFAGTTGTLKIDDALAFNGQISGLAGSDTVDLADISYGANTKATFLGSTAGGTLTVTDGTRTANIELVGNFLSSTWTLSSDGAGGTNVVDPVSSNNWQPMAIGAGGYLTGMDIAPDDTLVVRTDTNGAYIWNGTEWQELVTATSMPSGFVAPDGQGVYEIQIAPSNSSIMYMMYDGNVFKSTNKGTTWTETNFTPVTENTNDAYRMDGQKMAVDPNNPNVVYVGTPQNGLFVTTDGGNTWQSVGAVPVSLTDPNGIYPGITGIEFDPANPDIVFAASYGNGVYETTNAGTSWSELSGGPSEVEYAAISSTGVYYAIGDNNTGLWSYANGVWTELLSGSIKTVAIDPFNPNEIIAAGPNGDLNESLNGGTSWAGWANNTQLTATDIPWLAGTSPYMVNSGLVFDQLVPNELLATGANGFWETTVPTNVTSSTPIVWISQSVGIEQLVANEILVPPGGDPVLASWDRPFFYVANSNIYPSTVGPQGSSAIVGGWSLDYASSDPSFVVGIADGEGGPEESGYSTNGGQTWTPFPTDPPGAGANGDIGGTIAASTPSNIIWAPADGYQPYYTLDGGETWNPIVLPGVSSWSGFDSAYYLDTRTVTADRVLPNTFYLYYPGYGVYETTDGGVAWTQVYSGKFPGSGFNSELQSVPGEAGNLFYTSGPQGGAASPASSHPFNTDFYQSTNGGATWTAIPNVLEVQNFGFGAPATPGGYPAIYIVGWVNDVYGIWQSINDAKSWTQIGAYPTDSLNHINAISGDPNIYGQVYVGFAGAGYAEFTADPAVTGVAASPSSGVEVPGNTVTLTLTMSEAVTVTGAPTLSLNDGGTATYTGGSGSNELIFSYTVSTTDSDVSGLGITQVNLPNGATIEDANGNAAILAGAVTTFSGLQIDPPVTVSSVVASGSGITNGTGDLDAGHAVTLTVDLSGVVTVNGTPTLTLNDGGTATYTSGSGTNALTFSYKVAVGQNTPDLAVMAVNLGTATVTDAVGNAANFSGAVTTFSGLQIDTTAPTVSSVVASGSGITNGAGDLNAGHVVTLTVNLSEAVTVANGTPTLTLNDGGTATYTGGSGTNALTFSYTVAAGQNTPGLAVWTVNLGTATVTDAAGNPVNFAGALTKFSGLQIDATPPTVSSVVVYGPGIANGAGDVTAGQVVHFNVNMSEVVTVTGGTPALTLNDGGTATYISGSGTEALAFSYTVATGQNTPNLALTAVNLGTASVTDAAGNAANLAGAVTTFSGIQIGSTTTAATVSSVVASGSGITNGSGDLNAGQVITLTANLSEAVTVANGTPTLTLNDGGTATYTSGSGTSALVFSYTVAAGQNTPDLAVTAVNLNSATITDGAGNAANLSGAITNPSGTLQIDTTPPTISSIVDSPSSGDLNAGKVVTFTLDMSEVVTVNTTGGIPTLSLNDGGTATYVSGSGANALTFSYTVVAGQNTPDLTVSAVNLNGATVQDGAGNAANLSLTGLTQGSPQIDTTPPTVSSVTATAGDYDAGNALTVTLNMSEAVNVSGTPTLTLNDGGTATYESGSGSNTLVFSYTVAAGQNTTALEVTGVTGTITDLAGNALTTANLPETFSSVIVDTTPPTVSAVTATAGDYDAGKVLTLTLNMSEAVNVSGTPTLTLNDGGTATYESGSGSNTLVFSYTVAAGQNTTALEVTGVTGTIKDVAGNTLSIANLPETFSGVIVDTTPPTVSSVTTTAGDYDAGKVLTLTLHMSEAVNVTGSPPTLTLNDGGTATYVTGTSSSTLVFSYTVVAGQNTTALEVTGVTGTIKDVAGNTLSTANLPETFSGVIVDTTPPTVSSVTTTAGDYDAGKVLTLTLHMSEAVNVTGSPPTLTLNDGGTATYVTGTSSSTLVFSYTVVAGQNTTALEVTGVTGTIKDVAGNTLSIANLPETFSGVIVDTTPPAAPVITSDTVNANNSVTLSGTAAANSTVTVYDGQTALGTTTANASGTWSYTTGTLASGSQTCTATATDAAGNTSPASNSIDPIIGLPTDDWKTAVSANWSTTADWSAGVPTSSDLVVLNAAGTYTVTSSANETIAELNTISTATLAISSGTFTITSGTGTGDQAGTISVAQGATLDLDGTFANSGILLANGGTVNIDGGVTRGTTEISGTGKVVIALASSENVTFLAKSTGELVLDSTSYTGEISGFGANTTQSIDLADINFAAGAKIVSYVANSKNTGGVLTITSGTNTIELQLVGTYKLANFAIKSDSSGGTFLTDPPLVEQMPGNGSATIANGTVLEINTPDKGSVTFAGSTGTLWLDQPSTFTGTVSGFKAQDVIDLPGLAFGAQTTLGYLPNSKQAGGTLAVTNGTQSANIALLGNYIASSFATVSDGHGGTMVVAEASQTGSQPLLSNPQHA